MSLIERTTPGGRSTSAKSAVSRPSDSGEPATTRKERSESPKISDKHPISTLSKIRPKRPNFLATFNANSLLKIGKLKHLTDTLSSHKICIAAIQETRFTDDAPFESQGFRVLKSKTSKRILKGVPHLGTGFIISKQILDSIVDFVPVSNRLCTLSFRCTNKMYTIVNAHAPINADNRLDSEKVDTFWDTLEDTISKVHTSHTVILLGDFNAQIGRERKFRNTVGDYPAHKRTNTNGERLIDLCRSTGLLLKSTAFKHLPRKQKTWTSPNPMIGEFQIDHVAISQKSSKEIQNVKVLRSANLDSDHYLSKVKVSFCPRNTRKRPFQTIVRPNIEALKTRQADFALNTKVSSHTLKELENSMVQTALELAPQIRRPRHAWWSPECDVALSQRLSAWQAWNSHKTPEKFDRFIAARKLASKTFRMVKRRFHKSQMTEIQNSFAQNNTRSFYQTFKRNLTRYNPPSLNFTDPLSGKLAHNDSDNCRILANYFKNLLNCDSPKSNFPKIDPPPSNPDSSAPDLEELREIIKSLKNNKAPGENGLMAEYWKFVDDSALNLLHKTFQQIWSSSEIPAEWTSALIHPLHKKGDKKDVNNYRGISLLPVTYKILSKALLNRAEPQLDPCIGEYQAGFRKARSCAEQIFNLKSIISYFRLRSRDLYVVFIDFQKAYDSIDRSTLFQTLQEFGLDNKTREIIQSTLSNTSSKVKFRKEISEPFEIKSGVRQGDGLSPLLFNCALEKVIREWRLQLKSLGLPLGVRLGAACKNLTIDCLAFADDLALLSHDPITAATQIQTLQECASKFGLQISYSKTQFISSSKTAPDALSTSYGQVRRTNHFKYLGEWVSPSVIETTALNARIQKLETAYHLTRDVYNKKSISVNAKFRHYQTVIRPEALYAAECLALRKRHLTSKLEVRERKVLRKILGPVFSNGIRKLRPNSELYTHTEKITDTFRKRRIAFLGHVSRMPQTRLTNRIFCFLQALKLPIPWFVETNKDLQELRITPLDITERVPLRRKLRQGFQDRPITRRGAVFSEERKVAASLRMKAWWAAKKASEDRRRNY